MKLPGGAVSVLQALSRKLPELSVVARRAAKFLWWTITFQLFEKYRQRRQHLAALARIRPPCNDYALAVPFSWAPRLAGPPPQVAVICHMFFAEMAEEFKAYLSNIPFRFDLYITTNSDEKKQRIETVFSGWQRGHVEVRLAENRGRDIAPKLITCADVHGDYEYVLHIHTKRSPQAAHLAGWREYLLQTLIGSPEVVSSVFAIFKNLPAVGMIAPQHLESVRPLIGWGSTYPVGEELSRRLALKIDMDGYTDFPSGSMFWARSAALQPLLDAGLAFDDFPIEQGQTDATLAHAIERLYLYACEAAGYDWIKVARPELMRETRMRVVETGAADQLPGFLLAHRVRLLTAENTV